MPSLMAATTLSPQFAMAGEMLADVRAAPTQMLEILSFWYGCKAKELEGIETLSVLVALARRELKSRGGSLVNG